MGSGGMLVTVEGAKMRLGVSRISGVNQTISVVCSHNGGAGRKSGLSFFPQSGSGVSPLFNSGAEAGRLCHFFATADRYRPNGAVFRPALAPLFGFAPA